MSANPNEHMTDTGRREIERRWQALWEKGLREAIAKGLPKELAARTMMGAAVKVLLEVDGPERVAFYLGRLAYEFELAANPDAAAPDQGDAANLNVPPRH